MPESTAAPEEGPPRRRSDAERNHAAIVEAALRLFAQRPEATMAEVAATAGVGRVTLYAHFPSRHALLEAVVERAVAETVAETVDDVPPDAPAGEAMGALIRRSWRSLHRFGRLSALAQRELGPDRLRDRHGPVLDEVDALVARGQADGSLRSDLPVGWLVTTVYSLIHAAADEVDAGRLAAADAARVLEATLVPALSPPGGRPAATGPAAPQGG
jgi:AcrR family transcriptional regulator